jgi:hypothetical protein
LFSNFCSGATIEMLKKIAHRTLFYAKKKSAVLTQWEGWASAFENM